MVTAATLAANKGDAAKEASSFIHKGLEHALYSEVNEVDSIRSCKKKSKAVDFFLRRRERCDKYVRESVAPDREELERMAAEEEQARLEAATAKCQGAAKIVVEKIEVKPMDGQVKLPPMSVNVRNNSTVAKPFGAEAGSGWAPVSFTSPRLSTSIGMDSMDTSFYGNGTSECVFDTPIASSGHFSISNGRNYKPVAFMNFKPRNPAWRENGEHQRLQNTDVNDILAQVHAKEKADAARLAEQKKTAESSGRSKLPNGVGPVRLSKVSLGDSIGKWRPSNDNWRPGVNTDGFFKAIGMQKDIEEKKIGYKNDSLMAALKDAEYADASCERQSAMVNGRMSEVNAAKGAKCVQTNKSRFV